MFNQQGFLAYAIGLEELNEEDTKQVEEFDKMIRRMNQECGNIKNSDRCDYAFEFTICWDRVLLEQHTKNSIISDG